MKRRKYLFWTVNLAKITDDSGRSLYYQDPPKSIRCPWPGLKGKYKNYHFETYAMGKRAGEIDFTITNPKHCHGHDVSTNPGVQELGIALFMTTNALKFLWGAEKIRSVDAYVEINPISHWWMSGDKSVHGEAPLFDGNYSPEKSLNLCLKLGFKLVATEKRYGGLYKLVLHEPEYKRLVEHGPQKKSRRALKQQFLDQLETIKGSES